MKWQGKKTTKRNRVLLEDVWSPWFAWHPIKLTETETWVWLENIERKFVRKYSCMFMYDTGSKHWSYRYKESI